MNAAQRSQALAWFAGQPRIVRGAFWAITAAGFFTGMPI